MKEADVIRIVSEERGKYADDMEMVVRSQVRVALAIAENTVRSALSDEEWGVFQDLLSVYPLFITARPTILGLCVVIPHKQYFDALATLERVLHFLLDAVNRDPSHMKNGTPADTILSNVCQLSVCRDELLEEHKGQPLIIYPAEDALHIATNIMGTMITFAGEEAMKLFYVELLSAFRIIATHLK